MARHDDEIKRHRQKWRAKQAPREPPLNPAAAFAPLLNALKTPMPAHWPGAADPSLVRPDRVKFELAEFAFKKSPGKAKARQLDQQLQSGLLEFLPELDHWAMEMFLWHGLPEDPWHPVDAFLEHAGKRFPPPAQEQLRLCKEARLGLFEVGAVRDDTVELREWDAVNDTLSGKPFRAISLNIGGVNGYREAAGHIHLTYLAPWAPADNLFCALGYGVSPAKRDAAMLVPYLGLNHPDIVARPVPWKTTRTAADEYLRRWRTRDWHAWLAERLQFPFPVVALPEPGRIEVAQVTSMVSSTPEHARLFGVYLQAARGGRLGGIVAGATTVTAIDVTTPTAAALAEYRAYRERVGPPPGTVGQPEFLRLK